MGDFEVRSSLRQHAGEDSQPEALLVLQAVGPALKDSDLVVEALDEAERDLVLWLASRQRPSQ